MFFPIIVLYEPFHVCQLTYELIKMFFSPAKTFFIPSFLSFTYFFTHEYFFEVNDKKNHLKKMFSLSLTHQKNLYCLFVFTNRYTKKNLDFFSLGSTHKKTTIYFFPKTIK